jgi:mannose-6-phosphate isomerase-like protein (cupin superfamily)
MAVHLEGQCVVQQMKEGIPVVAGTLSVWHQIGRVAGAAAISLRFLEFKPGTSPGISNDESDEVLYFCEALHGSSQEKRLATIFIDGSRYEVRPQTGIYLQPKQTLTVENPGLSPILFVSSQCPEPSSPPVFHSPSTSVLDSSAKLAPIVRLVDRKSVPTGDRWYRVLVDNAVGSQQVTQFIGSIPGGRAPDHFHEYEEVLFILRGEGRMWAGKSSTPLGPGSCVYLPRHQIHCVENTGAGELRLLGVFYPAGSPSVRYEPERS